MIIYPEYISFEDWAASLLIDFNKEHIPLLNYFDKWEDWANEIALKNTFKNAGVPLAKKPTAFGEEKVYNDPMEWAKDFYAVMIKYKKK